jgi:hypothetical protein
LGLCSSFGRFGAIVGTALVNAEAVYGNPVALVLVGLAVWVAGVAVHMVAPEMADKDLKDYVDQKSPMVSNGGDDNVDMEMPETPPATLPSSNTATTATSSDTSSATANA